MLSDQEINIAIAEWCGWKYSHKGEPTSAGWYRRFYNSDGRPACAHAFHACEVEASLCLPRYTTDLNAMHEAEKKLNGVQQNDYTHSLGFPADDVQHAAWKVCHATARQRAEALLRTIGKWKE